jgi:ferredoxin-NADP reductase
MPPFSVLTVTLVAVALIGLVAVRLFIECASALRGSVYDRQRRQRSLALLDEQIQAARAQQARHDAARFVWNGYRKFVVARKVHEAEGVCSFYLTPHDGKKLPLYKPGQFLTFRLDIAGHDKPVVRCYSLSDAADESQWRVTIKRVPPPRDKPEIPAGLISNYFHDSIHEGAILDVKSPGGNFVLDPVKQKPAVLIGGGIGITPMVSMARAVAQSGSGREIWLFYGVRHRGEHALEDQIKQLGRENANIRVITCYSNPREEDQEGRDFDHAERVGVDLMKRYLESSNYEFYMCGPPPMMESVTKQLADWGVEKRDIFTEAFGPASVKAKKRAAAPKVAVPKSACKVKFAKCGKEVAWDPQADNLLEFSESHSVDLQGGCRAGNCGTCEVAIVSGEVEYAQPPEYADLGDRCCLTCISVPKGDVVLDA